MPARSVGKFPVRPEPIATGSSAIWHRNYWDVKDDALEESSNLPAPDIIAQEITDDLEAAISQFAAICEEMAR